MKNLKENNVGITLIALVLTIIILLLLAGITLSLIAGSEGILGKASNAVDKNEKATAEEQAELLMMDKQSDYYDEKYVGEGYAGTKRDYLLGKLKGEKNETEDYYVEVSEEGEIEIYDKMGSSQVPVATGSMSEDGTIEWDEEIKVYEIEVSEIKDKSVTISLTTGLKEGESLTYIVETGENKIERQNITESKQVITGLSPETNYTVYVIINTSTGRNRVSNKIEITTPEAAFAMVGEPNTANTYRNGNQLPFNWTQINDIAKGIAENSQTITKDTLEFKLKYEGKEYTIGVGDYTTVNGKKVRILGFNHDELINKSVYGEGTSTTYAGISFEYVDFLVSNSRIISSMAFYSWGNCALRGTLNGSLYNGVKGSVNVKKVRKPYCASYSSDALSYSEDYLWLLSGEEIWGGRGNSGRIRYRGKEGTQYKYYKTIGASTLTQNNRLKKPSNKVGSSTKGTAWWLRSVGCDSGNWNRTVREDGYISGIYEITFNYTFGVAPGFSI